MLKIQTPVQYLKGVGPKMAKKLKSLGIETVQDLLFYFPRRWDDLSQVTPIKNLRIGNVYNIKAKILSITNQRSFRKRMNITSAIVEDEFSISETSSLKLVWFNQPFLIRNLKAGQTWIFSGKVEWDFKAKTKVMMSPIYESDAKILPVYAVTEGITSKYLKRLVKNIFAKNILLSDFLPEPVRREQNLIELNQALKQIHFPSDQNSLSKAKERLSFDELFIITFKMLLIRKELSEQNAPKMRIYKDELQKLVKRLPYQLTNAQRKASWEIIQNLTKSVPMNRLLEGDVGSGKTIVACMAVLNAIKNGFRVAWMAPTEILVNQHYKNVSKVFKQFNFKISILTRNQKNKNSIIKSDLIIGTHALLEENIKFSNLGLVIIDEQHRFGVEQRAKLRSTNNELRIKENESSDLNHNSKFIIHNSDVIPHFLSMTATPIPRTLALSIYGDLDISILDQMPLGRQKIITRLIDPVNREKAYEFIRKQIKLGRQIYVICPLIESNNQSLLANNLFDLDRKSVKKEYEKLSREIFPDLKVAILHGKMKSIEKEKVMRKFENSEIDILVSTSVVEVGIDVPNATVMLIEDADRFGLAQLHQFRGRVGRGSFQSYCLLFTNTLSLEINKRLKVMEECSDGFKLAEKDLEIRGPGQFSGTLQHGIPDLKIASLTDIILIQKAKSVAGKMIQIGLDKYPLIIEKIKEFGRTSRLE